MATLQPIKPLLNLAPQTPTNMSSTTPSVGAQAKSPSTNVKPPTNILPTSQIAPTTAPKTVTQTGNTSTQPVTAGSNNTAAAGNAGQPNTGLVGGTSALSTDVYNQATNGLLNSGDINSDPTYQRMLSELNGLQQKQPQDIKNILQDPTRGSFASVINTRTGLTNQQDQNAISNKQNEINTYLSGRGQSIGALSSAGGLTSPQNQVGFLTNPQTGKPIYGNGSIGGLSGLAYQAGQINNAGTLAGQGQNQAIAINNARDTTTQLSNLLKTSSLNQNQLAISNWVGNVVAQNLSNPTLAPIQNAITSAINQYAQAIGVSPADLTSSLLSQSGGQSILAVLGNLDTQAYNNYTNTGKVATGGGVSAPVTNLGTASNAASGVTTGGNKYVITP